MISQSLKLTIFFISLLLLTFILLYCNLQLGDTKLFSFFRLETIGLFSSYFLLGLGIAIPLITLATLFGWLQFILLMTGNISPHLAKEGFFKVLETLFSRI